MIEIGIDPQLAVGPLVLTWHALFGVLAMITGGLVGVHVAARRFAIAHAYDAALAGLTGGLIGSRVFHVVDEWPRYAADPLQALAVWNGGASITGGIACGVLAGIAMARWRGVRMADVLDAGALALPLGMAVGRIGDLINGEHWATACDGLPWCVRYTHPSSPGQREPVHPAVGYEALLDLAIFACVVVLRRQRALEGRHMYVFLGLYGAGRLALASVRLDPVFAFGVSQAVVVSLAFCAWALVGLLPAYGKRLWQDRIPAL